MVKIGFKVRLGTFCASHMSSIIAPSCHKACHLHMKFSESQLIRRRLDDYAVCYAQSELWLRLDWAYHSDLGKYGLKDLLGPSQLS